MTKAIVRVGYKDYVMTLPQAIQFSEMLGNIERYESKYHVESDNKTTNYTYHIHQEEEEPITEIKLISDHHYRVAKAAGKPAK
jgi:hypothetical protein